jgi:hypothetical protein
MLGAPFGPGFTLQVLPREARGAGFSLQSHGALVPKSAIFAPLTDRYYATTNNRMCTQFQ